MVRSKTRRSPGHPSSGCFGPRACPHGRSHVRSYPLSRVPTGRKRNGRGGPGGHCGAESLLLSDSGFSLNENRQEITVGDRFPPGFLHLFFFLDTLELTPPVYRIDLNCIHICMVRLVCTLVGHNDIIVGRHLQRNSCRTLQHPHTPPPLLPS